MAKKLTRKDIEILFCISAKPDCTVKHIFKTVKTSTAYIYDCLNRLDGFITVEKRTGRNTKYINLTVSGVELVEATEKYNEVCLRCQKKNTN